MPFGVMHEIVGGVVFHPAILPWKNMKETTPHTSPQILPGGRVLLHACCAPCSGAIMETLAASAIEYAIFFYNPNIHPEAEYLKRKHEITRYADKCGVPVIDADYDPGKWFSRAKGMETEPEHGRRCTMCFMMRLERAARYANENGYSVLATTLGISRWKNLDQVNACGRKAVSGYATVTYWDCNWRKQGGATRMMEIAKREGFYRQNYCGCVYSLRDTERRCCG